MVTFMCLPQKTFSKKLITSSTCSLENILVSTQYFKASTLKVQRVNSTSTTHYHLAFTFLPRTPGDKLLVSLRGHQPLEDIDQQWLGQKHPLLQLHGSQG